MIFLYVIVGTQIKTIDDKIETFIVNNNPKQTVLTTTAKLKKGKTNTNDDNNDDLNLINDDVDLEHIGIEEIVDRTYSTIEILKGTAPQFDFDLNEKIENRNSDDEESDYVEEYDYRSEMNDNQFDDNSENNDKKIGIKKRKRKENVDDDIIDYKDKDSKHSNEKKIDKEEQMKMLSEFYNKKQTENNHKKSRLSIGKNKQIVTSNNVKKTQNYNQNENKNSISSMFGKQIPKKTRRITVNQINDFVKTEISICKNHLYKLIRYNVDKINSLQIDSATKHVFIVKKVTIILQEFKKYIKKLEC